MFPRVSSRRESATSEGYSQTVRLFVSRRFISTTFYLSPLTTPKMPQTHRSPNLKLGGSQRSNRAREPHCASQHLLAPPPFRTPKMKKHTIHVLSILSITLLIPLAAHAQYSFTNIADSTGAFFAFGSEPSINNNGVVAFWASLRSGGEGVFRGSGGSITTIADTTSTFTSFGGNTSINDSGTVAFYAALNSGASGIFRGSGGAFTTIADNTSFFPLGSAPSINSSGTVAFFANRPTFVAGIYAGNGGAPFTIIDTSGPLTLFSHPSFNDSGTAAFLAALDGAGSGSGVFRSSGGAVTTIANASGSFSMFFGNPSINSSGTVAFATPGAIAYGSGGPAVILADTLGPFSAFDGDPSINDTGSIAFFARLDSGGSGIFTGPNPIADKVIATGDTLFGSTVTVTNFFTQGINDSGQVVFAYQLANGVRGVAVATVPEPTSCVLLMSGAAIFVLVTKVSEALRPRS